MLALVSLADLDGFYKDGKWAEAKGQNYNNWIRSVGKKTLLSWSARAAIRAAPSNQLLDAVAPVAQPGDLRIDARAGGSVSVGVSQSSSSVGQAAVYPPIQPHRGLQTPAVSGGASGTNGPTQSVSDMSVGDLIKMLRASGLSESELSTIYKTCQ